MLLRSPAVRLALLALIRAAPPACAQNHFFGPNISGALLAASAAAAANKLIGEETVNSMGERLRADFMMDKFMRPLPRPLPNFARIAGLDPFAAVPNIWEALGVIEAGRGLAGAPVDGAAEGDGDNLYRWRLNSSAQTVERPQAAEHAAHADALRANVIRCCMSMYPWTSCQVRARARARAPHSAFHGKHAPLSRRAALHTHALLLSTLHTHTVRAAACDSRRSAFACTSRSRLARARSTLSLIHI